MLEEKNRPGRTGNEIREVNKRERLRGGWSRKPHREVTLVGRPLIFTLIKVTRHKIKQTHEALKREFFASPSSYLRGAPWRKRGKYTNYSITKLHRGNFIQAHDNMHLAILNSSRKNTFACVVSSVLVFPERSSVSWTLAVPGRMIFCSSSGKQLTACRSSATTHLNNNYHHHHKHHHLHHRHHRHHHHDRHAFLTSFSAS